MTERKPPALWRRGRFWGGQGAKPKLTRVGWVVIVIALASGAAAINTGNNLLYLCWGVILASIVGSGVLSEFNLLAIRLQAPATMAGRVRDRCNIDIALQNRSRFLPAFGIHAHVRLRTKSGQEEVRGEPVMLLSAMKRTRLQINYVPNRRGRTELAEIVLATEYPFGFFRKSRSEMKQTVSFDVWPERLDVRHWLQRLSRAMGNSPTANRGDGDEFFSLKNFEQGDDPRKIAWRRSAKAGRMMVQEQEAEAGGVVWLVLDPKKLRPQQADDFATEKAIAFVGALAEGLLQGGHRVGVTLPGLFLQPARTQGHLHDVLTGLALFDDPTQELLVPPRHQFRITVRAAEKPTALEPAIMELG